MSASQAQTQKPPPRSPAILVVDDSSTIRRSAEIFLSQAGYSVLLADDGFEALSCIVDHEPALVFCDILMPRLDGYHTCSLIRTSERFRNLPVVLLSSRDGIFDRARGALAGASAYLTKPFAKESLLQTVRDLLPPPAS
jgi:twitching motility two-component system response regulator PilG